MKTYRVEWIIDVDAESPRAAAEQAWGHLRRPDSTANCFEVTEFDGFDPVGEPVTVDLACREQEEDEKEENAKSWS